MAIGGSVSLMFNSNDWNFLNDGDRTYDGIEGTMGQTTGKANGIMVLDFGVDGVKANRVRVVHSAIKRRLSNGVTLQAMDPKGVVIFTYIFRGINVSSPTVDTFDMSGRKL